MTSIVSFAQRNPLNAILWQFRREFFVVGLFSLIVNLLMLTPTVYMLQVYDRIMVSQNRLTLLAVSLLALFFFLVMAIADWLRSKLLVRAGVRFDSLINTNIFNATFEAALNQARRNPSEAFTDLMNLRQFMTGNGIFAFFDLPWTLIYIAVAGLLHPWLGMIALFFALMLGGISWLGHHFTANDHKRVMEAGFRANGYAQNKLRNFEVIESLGMLDNLRRRWGNLTQQYLDLQDEVQERGQRMQALTKFVQLSQQSLTLGAAGWLVVRGELSVGSMIAANVLMGRALQPMQLLVASWKGFMTARLSYQRLVALLSEFPERSGIALSEPLRGQISLRQLTAKAENRQAPILDGLDADFQPGEIVVILGPSGSGKSTLARCLLGIWPMTSGQVLLDGIPVAEWDRHELGPHLGYLPQDIELFEGTIAENIARFGPLESEKVIAAAKATGVHEMILRFPQGYDTPMGVAGSRLSGGQRQRIALARALYGNPAIVVLDEPNANLDDVGETALKETILQLKAQGKTVILITHRGSIVNCADRLLVLINGRIRHFGSPAEVLQQLGKPAAAPALQPV